MRTVLQIKIKFTKKFHKSIYYTFLGKALTLCFKYISKYNKYKPSQYTTLFVINHQQQSCVQT